MQNYFDNEETEQDEMRKIVKCPVCGNKEYYGMIHMLNGVSMCRRCIYKIWKHKSQWKPGEHDYLFPLYEDGKDYSKEV